MIKLLSKLVYLILIILSFLVIIFIGTYCNDLAKYLLTPYSDFVYPLTMLMVFPLFMLAVYLVGYACLYITYTIRFLLHNYVYANLFVPFHRTTKSFKFHKRIGMEDHYWDRVVTKEMNK